MIKLIGVKNAVLLMFAFTWFICVKYPGFMPIALAIGLLLIMVHIFLRPTPKTISKSTFKTGSTVREVPPKFELPNKLMPVGQPKREQPKQATTRHASNRQGWKVKGSQVKQ